MYTYQNLLPDFEPLENISESATIKKKTYLYIRIA